MDPIIKSGQRVKVEPVDVDRLEIGDVVMVEVNGDTMLHQVNAIDAANRRVEIAGSSGAVNGWTSFDCVYAICTKIADLPVAGASAKTKDSPKAIARRRRRDRALGTAHRDPAATRCVG